MVSGRLVRATSRFSFAALRALDLVPILGPFVAQSFVVVSSLRYAPVCIARSQLRSFVVVSSLRYAPACFARSQLRSLARRALDLAPVFGHFPAQAFCLPRRAPRL